MSGGTAVLYVGREREVPAPPGWLRLDCWQVLPVQLRAVLEQADQLSILDPLSFPFDALSDEERDIPLSVRLPEEWDADRLAAVFGAPLLEHLTPLDEIRLGGEKVWAALRERYGWTDALRRNGGPDGAALPGDEARRARRAAKAAHRLVRRAIEEQAEAAAAVVPVGQALSTLLLGAEAEHWRPALPGAAAELNDSVPAAQPQESVVLALAVRALCDQPEQERRRRLAALLAALKVGGRLVVIDRFLDGRRGQTIGAPAPRVLLEELLESSHRHLVLEQVSALRCRGEPLASYGLFAFTKLGRPERL